MAIEQLTDQEKLFRVRARRRLIGAVALVLLMLTILPMLLDDRSNQKMPVPDVAISIPSQDDGNFASKIVPVAPTPVTPEESAQVEVMQSPVESPPTAETKPVETAPVIEKPVVIKPKPEPTITEKVEEKALTEKTVEDKKVGVSVQVGVIAEGEKVKQVVSKIEGLGLKAHTENLATPTGIKVRIRSGPYPNKEEAEKALEALKTVGFKPILVIHK